jgi:hypothetical protein
MNTRIPATAVKDYREHCGEDDGLRKCCGTRQLGPHTRACSLSPSFQQAVYDHERVYSHKTEVCDGDDQAPSFPAPAR